MKVLKQLTVLTILLLTACSAAFAQKQDEAAIKNVLNQETKTFFNKDYDGWAKTWVHDTAASMLRVNQTATIQLIGWNAISAQYKEVIQGLRPRTEAEIATFLNKTDFHIYINGNMATVSFKEGDKDPNTELRTMMKQNGTWKILNYTIIFNGGFDMSHIMENMKVFVGKWVLDGTETREPSNGSVLNSAQFVLWETPYGLEQTSDFLVTNAKGASTAIPTSYEYFIPDYNTNKIFYLAVDKNHAGQTFTEEGTITSNGVNSFTVTQTYIDKPDVIRQEYTVTMQNGKWHQVGKNYDRDGKLTRTSTMDFRRVDTN